MFILYEYSKHVVIIYVFQQYIIGYLEELPSAVNPVPGGLAVRVGPGHRKSLPTATAWRFPPCSCLHSLGSLSLYQSADHS